MSYRTLAQGKNTVNAFNGVVNGDGTMAIVSIDPSKKAHQTALGRFKESKKYRVNKEKNDAFGEIIRFAIYEKLGEELSYHVTVDEKLHKKARTILKTFGTFRTDNYIGYAFHEKVNNALMIFDTDLAIIIAPLVL